MVMSTIATKTRALVSLLLRSAMRREIVFQAFNVKFVFQMQWYVVRLIWLMEAEAKHGRKLFLTTSLFSAAILYLLLFKD
jgi:hypothetical protein